MANEKPNRFGLNFIERSIALVSPKLAFKRAGYRNMLNISIEQERKYDAAKKGRRTNGWESTSNSANTEIQQAQNFLRGRSRDLVRNNPYGKKTLRVISNNTIGSGIRVSFKPTGNKAADKKVKQLWADWAEKKKCDFNEQLNFYGLQKVAIRCIVESGEVLVRRRRVKGVVPIELQVIEPDLLDTGRNTTMLESGGYIMSGIEFDSQGKRVAYWLFDQHPGESVFISINIVSKRVPAEDVAHAYVIERPGQIRGVPFMVAAMMRMRDFDEYEDAQLIRQKIAACYAAFVRDFDGKVETISGNKKNKEGDVTERIEPGMISYLPAGKDITFASPPGAENYESYSKQIKQGIAAGNGITYESMTGDYSQVNFSSGRMGWLEMAKDVEDWQLNLMIPMFCETIFGWFTDAMKMTNVISKDIPVSWTTPRREMLDPVKEANALVKLIRAGLKPMPEAIREMGNEPEDVVRMLKEWQDIVDKNELTLDTDARNDIKEPSSDGIKTDAKGDKKKDSKK